MKNVIQRCRIVVALLLSLDAADGFALLAVAWRICASVRAFHNAAVTPKSFELLERRLERHGRQLAGLILQYTVNQIESVEPPEPVFWQDRIHLPDRPAWRTMDTRVGTIRYRRWVHQNEHLWVEPVAPLDHRLGLIGQRVSPGVAHKLGRLAADLPQQSAIAQLREQFGIRLSVDAYRKAVEHVSREIRFLHDDLAVNELLKWISEARERTGKHEVLLLVGRDGVHVPMRQSWKEAACSTIAVYDREKKKDRHEWHSRCLNVYWSAR